MTDEYRNSAQYMLYAVVGAVIATGLQLSIALAGTGGIEWRPLAAVFAASLFGSLATAFGTSHLVRPGSTAIAAQVDALKDAGVPKREMIVVPAATVETALSDRPFTDAQVAQLTVSLLAHSGKG